LKIEIQSFKKRPISEVLNEIASGMEKHDYGAITGQTFLQWMKYDEYDHMEVWQGSVGLHHRRVIGFTDENGNKWRVRLVMPKATVFGTVFFIEAIEENGETIAESRIDISTYETYITKTKKNLENKQEGMQIHISNN
jgi:hypothetical protein